MIGAVRRSGLRESRTAGASSNGAQEQRSRQRLVTAPSPITPVPDGLTCARRKPTGASRSRLTTQTTFDAPAVQSQAGAASQLPILGVISARGFRIAASPCAQAR